MRNTESGTDLCVQQYDVGGGEAPRSENTKKNPKKPGTE